MTTGSPIARNEPKVISSTTIAAASPTRSRAQSEVVWACSIACPPSSTCRSGARACSAAEITALDRGLRERVGLLVERHGRERDPAVARDRPSRRRRAYGLVTAVDVRQARDAARAPAAIRARIAGSVIAAPRARKTIWSTSPAWAGKSRSEQVLRLLRLRSLQRELGRRRVPIALDRRRPRRARRSRRSASAGDARRTSAPRAPRHPGAAAAGRRGLRHNLRSVADVVAAADRPVDGTAGPPRGWSGRRTRPLDITPAACRLGDEDEREQQSELLQQPYDVRSAAALSTRSISSVSSASVKPIPRNRASARWLAPISTGSVPARRRPSRRRTRSTARSGSGCRARSRR